MDLPPEQMIVGLGDDADGWSHIKDQREIISKLELQHHAGPGSARPLDAERADPVAPATGAPPAGSPIGSLVSEPSTRIKPGLADPIRCARLSKGPLVLPTSMAVIPFASIVFVLTGVVSREAELRLPQRQTSCSC